MSQELFLDHYVYVRVSIFSADCLRKVSKCFNSYAPKISMLICLWFLTLWQLSPLITRTCILCAFIVLFAFQRQKSVFLEQINFLSLLLLINNFVLFYIILYYYVTNLLFSCYLELDFSTNFHGTSCFPWSVLLVHLDK